MASLRSMFLNTCEPHPTHTHPEGKASGRPKAEVSAGMCGLPQGLCHQLEPQMTHTCIPTPAIHTVTYHTQHTWPRTLQRCHIHMPHTPPYSSAHHHIPHTQPYVPHTTQQVQTRHTHTTYTHLYMHTAHTTYTYHSDTHTTTCIHHTQPLCTYACVPHISHTFPTERPIT